MFVVPQYTDKPRSTAPEGHGVLTVTEQLAYFPLPSLASAFMIAVPLETAVTLPLASTVATASLLEDQLTLLSVASAGRTVAVSVNVLPIVLKVYSVLSNDTLSTGTTSVVNVLTSP